MVSNFITTRNYYMVNNILPYGHIGDVYGHLIKSDHMVSVYLLSFKIKNRKYAILAHMTFLFILK